MRSTLLLLTAALALGAYAYFVESERPTRTEAESAKDSAFALESSALVELEVTASTGERTVLRKTDGEWRLTQPIETGADAIEVSGITSGVASLEIERVVADSAADLAAFGLDEPRITLAFKAEGDTEFTRLMLGDETAIGGDMYATTTNDPRVFLVAAYLDGSFDRTTFDLRDKTILHFVRDDVDRLELTTAAHTVAMAENDDSWRLEHPWQAQADSGTVDTLVTRLATGRMQALIASDAEDLEPYGLAEPRVTAVVGSGSASATLQVGDATDAGTVYARDAARTLIFTIEQSLLDELTRAPDAYRRKDLFEFRSFSATRIEIDQPESRLVLEKSDDDTPVWHRLEPTPGDVDQAEVSAALSKLSGLRSESFSAADAEAGVDAPVATVTARFGEDQEERVVFGRVGAVVHAAVAGDSGTGVVDVEAFDAALADLNALGSAGAP